MLKAYPYLVTPEDYPEYKKRMVKAVTRKDLNDQIQFTTLRRFKEKDGEIVDYTNHLDLYTKQFKLGNIMWLFCSTLFMNNLNEVVDEIKKRGLYIYDIWGYVPGTNPEGQYWGNFSPPRDKIEYMRGVLQIIYSHIPGL